MTQKLAHYEIEDQLGEGAFAWVYRAFDPKFEQHIALKLLKPVWLGDPPAIGRFKQEARTARKLRHPHIVDVYDVGEAEGQIYLTALLVEGETLADRLARGPMAWNDVVKIATDMASALDYAHSQGIIHRDVKPQNILLGPDDQAFLADFGLVRAVEGSASLSASVSMVGTGHYMAPEVWDGKAATPATDVYALSCVIYEMLMGQVLFEGSSMMAVLKRHAEGPDLPDTWPTDVPDGVSDVLRRGLAEDPAERAQSAGELAAQLAALSASAQPAALPLARPEPAMPPPGAALGGIEAPTGPPSAKNGGPPWLLIGGAGGGLIIVAAIAFFTLNVFGGGGSPTVVVDTGTEDGTEIVKPPVTETFTPTATPTDTPTPSPTPPTPADTPTDTPTSTATPTDAPTHTATPTATPTHTPEPPPIVECSISANPEWVNRWGEKLGCPVAPQTEVAVGVEQLMQGGHLFWREDTNEHYVIFDKDKQTGADLFAGDWLNYQPLPTEEVVCPVEPHDPGMEGGFRWWWCVRGGGPDGLLGWPLDKQYKRDNLFQFQHFERGFVWRGSDPKTYALFDDNTFEAISGQ